MAVATHSTELLGANAKWRCGSSHEASDKKLSSLEMAMRCFVECTLHNKQGQCLARGTLYVIAFAEHLDKDAANKHVANMLTWIENCPTENCPTESAVWAVEAQLMMLGGILDKKGLLFGRFI